MTKALIFFTKPENLGTNCPVIVINDTQTSNPNLTTCRGH